MAETEQNVCGKKICQNCDNQRVVKCNKIYKKTLHTCSGFWAQHRCPCFGPCSEFHHHVHLISYYQGNSLIVYECLNEIVYEILMFKLPCSLKQLILFPSFCNSKCLSYPFSQQMNNLLKAFTISYFSVVTECCTVPTHIVLELDRSQNYKYVVDRMQ